MIYVHTVPTTSVLPKTFNAKTYLMCDVVAAQLTVWSLPIPENQGLNSLIGNFS